MGYSEAFNGKNYNEKQVFGSEIKTIKLAESLTDIYDIYIFVNISKEDEIIFNNVTYLQLNKLEIFGFIDILVIVRYLNFFLYYKNQANKLFIWIRDTIINPFYDAIKLENNGSNLLYNLKDNIDGYICLSDWHLINIKQQLNYDVNNINIIYNPLDISFYKENISIIKNRFIFVSEPSRGLELTLDCLIYIQNIIPDISLCVFRKNEFDENIINKLNKLNNVIIYGKETQEIVANEYLQSEYFFYPTHFYETFCNAAAEAQLYNTVCIYNNIGSLNTTINNRGLQINYDFNNNDYIKKTCIDVINLMNNYDLKQKYIKMGHEWAIKLDIKYIKKNWIELFNL